jgi:hypothetical protein
MPHVRHYDSTSGPGDARGTSHRQARGRRLFHASQHQGRSTAPVRNRDNEATSRSADLGRNRTRAELPANPNRTRATAGGPSQGGNSAAAAGGDREVVPHRDPGGGGSDSGSSNHGANRRAGGGGDRGGRGHANRHVFGASQGGFDARPKIEE